MMLQDARHSAQPWWLRGLLFAVLALLLGGFFTLGGPGWLSLGSLQANRQALLGLVQAHPLLAPLIYALVYAGLTGLTLPINVPLSLGAGALFGLAEGAAIVSFAAAGGASLSLLSSRFLLRDVVRRRLGRRLAEMEAGIARDGIVYLLMLRLTPAVPYVLVNLLFGLTSIPVLRFFWVTQLGTLPATLVFVNAGTQLETLRRVSDILSPGLIVSWLLLAVVPLAARHVVGRWRRARQAASV